MTHPLLALAVAPHTTGYRASICNADGCAALAAGLALIDRYRDFTRREKAEEWVGTQVGEWERGNRR